MFVPWWTGDVVIVGTASGRALLVEQGALVDPYVGRVDERLDLARMLADREDAR